jgi:pilus assembly protein CpaF
MADGVRALRREVRDQLRVRIDARGLASSPPGERRVRVRQEALDLLRERGALLPQRELARIVNEVSDEVVGFGPIEPLLQDPSVTEVMVNGPDDVFVEREGRIERVPGRLFEGEESIVHLIERIVGPLGLRVDQASPWVDARLPDGSRVHAIVPPLSLRGPTITIRKFSQVPITPQVLIRTGSAGPRAMRFLLSCVRGRANVVISGGAGTGKTTLLGVLAEAIPDEERLITIEDAAELRLAKPHVVSLEARPPNVEGRGEVTRHVLWRLETMALMSDVELPAAHVRAQVAAAIDLVVQSARLRDGRRVIWEIATVQGTSRGEPVVEPVFRFDPRTGNGACVATGHIPPITESLRARGEGVPTALFEAGVDA